MTGTIVNTLAAVVGGLLGCLLKKGIPERFADLVQKGLALCVLYIGIKGSLAGTNTLVTILSLVLDLNSVKWFNGYHFSYELLLMNAGFTILGLMMLKKR